MASDYVHQGRRLRVHTWPLIIPGVESFAKTTVSPSEIIRAHVFYPQVSAFVI